MLASAEIEFKLEKEPTASMSADIFTKAFHEKSKWNAVRELINVIDFTNIEIKLTPA